MSLKGKNVIITGATSGIGEAIATALSQNGASVFLGGRRADKGEEVAKSIGAGFHVVDVAREDSNQAFFEAAQTHFGGVQTVDYIFLNAGVEGSAEKTAITSMDISEYEFVFGINVRGVLFGLQYGTPLLRKSGTFVLTSSAGSILPFAALPVYAASKSAVDGLVRSYAAQFQSATDERIQSLSILGINPGVYGSEMLGRVSGGNTDMMEGMGAAFNVSGRIGQTQELAATMVQLLEGKLPYKSGDLIAVDADLHMHLAEYLVRLLKRTSASG